MSTQLKSWLPAYSSKLMSRRRFLGAAGAGAGAAALIACGGGGSTTEQLLISPEHVRQPGAVLYSRDSWQLADESANAAPGGIFPGRSSADLTEAMDPLSSTVGATIGFLEPAYEYLLTQNRGPGIKPGTAEYRTMIGHLAESWEVSSDATRYTFTLRPNVKFMNIAPVNGRVMDIEDWRSTVKRNSEIGGYRSALNDIVDKIEFPDSRHMTMIMKYPYAPLPARMNEQYFIFRIVPRELNEKPEIAHGQTIGTGYRYLDKNQPSVTFEWKRNDTYWQGKPFIDRWHYPIITETANAYAQFLAQNIITFSPGARDALRLRADAPEAIMQAGSISTTSINRMHFGHPDSQTTAPWKDARVRIALRRAVDWQTMSDFTTNKDAFSAAGIELDRAYSTHVPPDPDYFLDPLKGELGSLSQNYLYDQAEARKLLDAAGYGNGFEIDVWGGTSGSANPEQQKLVLDEWRKNLPMIKFVDHFIGIQEFYDRVLLTAEYKGIMLPHGSVGNDVDYLLFKQYHRTGIANAFPDPKADELVEAQRKAVDPDKRIAILKDIQLYEAEKFQLIPSFILSASWSFAWNWLHNTNQPPHLQWLDPNMPRRNG
jgi:ABC-type transport system substrate-binding protein